jgi:putative peptide zinc metalloprotease protein
MSTASEAFGSAAARRLAMRMRPDLCIAPQEYASRRYWLVKDPVALRYYHLGEEEHAVLAMLDGRTSLLEMQRRFQADFAPLQVTLEQLYSFVGHLAQLGLLLVESPGQTEALLERRIRRRRSAWLETATSVLAIRFRGVDPEPLLRWLGLRCTWLFSPWFLGACLALVAGAVILAALCFDVLAAKLPEMRAFLSPGNLLWLAVCMALAKGLHELGHALTCKHFGGACHEIGILLLVFTPCLYCNVSDVWLFANKWHRIAVSAAGILVEIVLASACLFLWWFSEPGLANTLFLNMVVVCSVNTLLLNGNPLLRYDGYYVLADLIEVPNLSQQARAVLRRGLERLFLGENRPPARYVPKRLRALVGVYGIASLVYRCFVLVLVLWVVYKFLKPYNLEVLAELVAVLAIAGMIAMPLWSFASWFSNPLARQSFRPGRAAVSCLVCVLVAAAALLIPLPFRIYAPAVIEPQGGRSVYVVVPGRLVEAVQPGEHVAAKQELGRLASLDLAREVADLSGQREQQRLRLMNLRLRLADDLSVAPQIPPAQEALRGIESRLAQRQRDQQQLVLRAPEAGTVIPAPWQPAPPFSPDRLRAWSGDLLEPRNVGAYLESGTLFCVIGDPLRLEAVLVVDQADMQFVSQGQRVRLKLDQMPGRVVEGTITEVSKTDLKVAPRELAKESGLAIRLDRAGIPHPASTSYQARVALDACPQGLLVGAHGQAKILAAPQSLGSRIYHGLSQVFRFAL